MTEFHFLLLYKNRFVAMNHLSEQVVYDKPFRDVSKNKCRLHLLWCGLQQLSLPRCLLPLAPSFPLLLLLFSLLSCVHTIDPNFVLWVGCHWVKKYKTKKKKKKSVGQLVDLARDVTNNTSWCISQNRIFQVVTDNEDRDVWKLYLEQGKFNEALGYCKDMNQVREKIHTHTHAHPAYTRTPSTRSPAPLSPHSCESSI